MVRALHDYLTERAARADKVGFTLRDGREFLGWLVEVSADHALLSWAPSPLYAQATGGAEWEPEDEWLPLTEIVPTTPAHYSRAAGGWIPFARDP
ncbi:hypothetical protein ACH41E_18020 [Streptomyces sp. NPDC020412]|uniref:hypothetical protein n=1 Tax=Streptomyces sp. NPDC020412 TaxID=3365073 RepID=UPI0037B9F3E7